MTDPAFNQEQSFLENIFQQFIYFNYERVKELASKEKSGKASGAAVSCWASLLSAIGLIAQGDMNYNTLTFLEQKWFGRRESGRSLYAPAVADLMKVEQKCGPQSLSTSDHLIGHIGEQLMQYTKARQDLMDFYVKLCNLGPQKNEVNFQEIVDVLKAVIMKHSKSFHHPVLVPLRNSWTYEVEIMLSLLEARISMTKWQFLPSLLKLNDANTKLEIWAAPFRAKEPKKKLVSLALQKGGNLTPLINWIIKYYAALLSKFTLYFYETLSKQSPSGDLKNQLANLSIDYYGKIVAFQRKSDAMNVSLVFDTRGSDYAGHGYHLPVGDIEPPTGLESYPAVFSYPQEKPFHLWPMVVMLLNQIPEGPVDKVSYFYDKHQNMNMTYFIIRVDAKVYLLLIFEAKKSEKDSTIINFLQDISSCLRGTRLLQSLKQGAKAS